MTKLRHLIGLLAKQTHPWLFEIVPPLINLYFLQKAANKNPRRRTERLFCCLTERYGSQGPSSSLSNITIEQLFLRRVMTSQQQGVGRATELRAAEEVERHWDKQVRQVYNEKTRVSWGTVMMHDNQNFLLHPEYKWLSTESHFSPSFCSLKSVSLLRCHFYRF